MFKRILDFLLHGVWRVKVKDLPFFRALGVRSLRFFILIVRSFTKEDLQEKASVLSYYTLLALVPILATIIAITRSFFLEEAFTQMLMRQFQAQEELIRKVISMGRQAIDATANTPIMMIGILIFFWSTFKIISYLEKELNHIFHSRETRSLLRRFSDYLAVVVLSPLFLSLSTVISIYISGEIGFFAEEHERMGVVLYFLLNIFSYFLISFLFTFLYLFLTNTKVEFFAALMGGLIAGLIYQVFQIAYFNTQIFISKANPILGTVSILPLLLIWVQLSWLILILGAKITTLLQNVDAYEFMVEDFALNKNTHQLLSLIITHYCVKEFCEGHPPPTSSQISDRFSLPLFLIRNVLHELEKAKILIEVKLAKQEEMGYHPTSDVENLTIKRVLDMINENGDEIPLPATVEAKKLYKSLETFSHLMEHSKANFLLKQI